ncbi:hypothetical protein ACO2Q0_02910 [Phenylobacterium sp. VNQ135]|uniref:hypothetical protein n=1 Tax=Phenylobacterium sp. VNQ135 TaxID=3400922 RepID=UPI003C125A0D
MDLFNEDPLISFDVIGLDELNWCLTKWGHKMGPINRPTPTLAHGLRHRGELVAVTSTDHLMAAAVQGLTRAEAVELSRVCAARPDLCRAAVRLWREFVFPDLSKHRGCSWAVSYQDAVIHGGNLYRFDGWVRLGFSHSGADRRTGRPGRDKYIWAWHADPAVRAAVVDRSPARRAAA